MDKLIRTIITLSGWAVALTILVVNWTKEPEKAQLLAAINALPPAVSTTDRPVLTYTEQGAVAFCPNNGLKVIGKTAEGFDIYDKSCSLAR